MVCNVKWLGSTLTSSKRETANIKRKESEMNNKEVKEVEMQRDKIHKEMEAISDKFSTANTEKAKETVRDAYKKEYDRLENESDALWKRLQHEQEVRKLTTSLFDVIADECNVNDIDMGIAVNAIRKAAAEILG